jgi:hypothetical protein
MVPIARIEVGIKVEKCTGFTDNPYTIDEIV